MASFFALIITLATIALILLIARISKKKSEGEESSLGIKINQNKNSIRLSARAEHQMNLVIEKSNKYSHFLENFPLFQQEKTGDAEFDALFQITAYRDDVRNILKTNAVLRRSIIQLTNDVPSFSSLVYSEEKISLVLRIGKLSKGEAQEFARTQFAAALEKLIEPFKRLPADTGKETRARKIDIYSPYLSLPTLVLLTIFSVIKAKPLATGEIPWKYVSETIVLLVILHFSLLVFLTKSAAARATGLYVVVFTFSLGGLNSVPMLVDEVNGMSEQDITTETVEFADLYMYKPSKGASHYYIQLAAVPERLAAGKVKSGPALEVSYDIYLAVKNAHLQQNSPMKISEARGSLGLPFVVEAVPG